MTIAFVKPLLADGQAPKGVPALPRPALPAHVVKDDDEAIAVAKKLAAQFVTGASERDRQRRWPVEELDAFSQSGLWSINVPKAFGGPEVSYATLAKVIQIISTADPSIGQIPQNHLGLVAAIRTTSSEDQQRFLYSQILGGVRLGNAFSEFGSKRASEFETKFTDAGDHVVVNGRKFYATGALLAHLVPIVALDEQGRTWYAIADRGAPGLTVIDDWSAFGQRTTLSGTVLIENVKVPKTHLIPAYLGYDRPSVDGAIFQIIQAAIDTGIAEAAINDAITFIKTKSRPWVDSGLQRNSDDPYVIQAIGQLKVRLSATEALLERAGRAIDRALANTNPETVAEAQIAVAESKIFSTELSLDASSKLFELGGTRSVLADHNLDRHWRNARTHTLHDPVRWKYAIVGNYALNDVKPPLHAWN
ncbi:MAG TPA: SfnB family sulfur acquisition oxidoreductase [Hyphomicrobium sp.]|nr:SfnB family sulfur acquisition oxidoreductase [Hyphomicrobium sp.]